MLTLLALYEPSDLDLAVIWSAVFLSAESYYVEVRVGLTASAVYQANVTTTVGNRLSCVLGEKLLESEYESEEAARKYFWSFVKDPEAGFMEATI